MPSVLVTGPRGLLGSTLLRVLNAAGWTVHPYEGDVTDAEALESFAASLPNVDAIVHTAAATDVNRCEQNQAWCTAVNTEGTRNVLAAAQLRGARLLFISTVSVFSGTEGNYREHDLPAPANHYSATKYEGEKVVAAYDKSMILRVNILGIHPGGSRGKNFMEWLVDSIRENKDMKLFTDIRINPLSNWTLAEMIRDLLVHWPQEKILHLASRDVLSKAEIGRMVLAHFPSYAGKVDEISSDGLFGSAPRPKEMWLNADAAAARGIIAPSLEAEIERILQS